MIKNFFEMCEHAKIDEKYIDIPIYDIAIKNLLENKLEEDNIVLHSQLNSKIFRLRADDLVMIYVSLISSYNETDIEKTKDKLILHIKKNKSKLKTVLKNIDRVSNFDDLLERIKSINMSEIFQIIAGFQAIVTVTGQLL